MSILLMRRLILGAWLTIVAASAAVLTTVGIPITGLAAVVLITAIVLPSVALSHFWKDPEPETISQVLHPLGAPDREDGASRGGRS